VDVENIRHGLSVMDIGLGQSQLAESSLEVDTGMELEPKPKALPVLAPAGNVTGYLVSLGAVVPANR
jgi:hypothetical protein